MVLDVTIAKIANVHLAMGLFALLVVAISLARIMAEVECPALTATKKFWGRRRGLLLHFLSHVGLPLVVGVVFLTRGITGPESGANIRLYDPVPQVHIVQHFIDLQQQAAVLINQAVASLDAEMLPYGPNWFKPMVQSVKEQVATVEVLEVLPRIYQTIP